MLSNTIFIAFVLVTVGCDRGSKLDPPTTLTADAPMAKPRLKAVDLQEGVYLARLEIHITITPRGLLRSVRTENKSHGPNDIDPKGERIEVREGQLSPRETVELAAMFSGWDSLSNNYPGTPDGEELQLRYGDKTVTGGGAPQEVWNLRRRIDELAARMPLVGRWKLMLAT